MKGCTGKYFLLRMWLLQAKDRVGAKARGGNRPGPEQGMRGQESGLGAGLAGAGCSCNGARPDPHTLLSARINNYLNFFHLSRDRNTGKHGKGKGIDPSQLLPTPPHCSHRSPHRAIWPSLPRASLLNRSSRSHTQTSTGPPRQPATQGGCGPHNNQDHPVRIHRRPPPLRQPHDPPDKPGLPWGKHPHPPGQPGSYPLC